MVHWVGPERTSRSDMTEKKLTQKLLSWYDGHARVLPWRGCEDPYAIWVSEVMLQQTRVESVIPYFKRWMERFPTIADVAQASEEEVLSTWEGLGYYRRARYLHQAAQRVREDHGGQLPSDPELLQELPGIGPYTAGAIASIAFGQDVPAVDGNVRRVITRLFNIEQPLHSTGCEREIRAQVRANLPPGRAGTFNQALMDLGAQLCTPTSPDCPRCPVAEMCRARALGIQEQRPVRGERDPIPHHTVTAAVIQRDGAVLIARRPPDGLLGGMWEFPGGKKEKGETLATALTREIKEELGLEVEVGRKLGVFQHAYTHFKITLHAFHCTPHSHDVRLADHTDWDWVAVQALNDYPMGKVDRLISRELQGDLPSRSG